MNRAGCQKDLGWSAVGPKRPSNKASCFKSLLHACLLDECIFERLTIQFNFNATPPFFAGCISDICPFFSNLGYSVFNMIVDVAFKCLIQ